MKSSSYNDLFSLGSGNFAVMGQGQAREKQRLERVATVPGVISELKDDQASSGNRFIVVANHLPVKANRGPNNTWRFSWDKDSLLLQLKDGFPADMEVLYVGSLRIEVDPQEENDVSKQLFDRFNCVPVFLKQDTLTKFYNGFCKQHLWPIFHSMPPISGNHDGRFDQSEWEAYLLANRTFYDALIEKINPEDDYIWIHDYHLMVLPTRLRRRFVKLRVGFFLHCPFPSPEIYRTLPKKEEILKCLLNCDLIGFHTYDYAGNFLSCCRRMLDLEHQLKKGYIEMERYGRPIRIKIMPPGIHMPRIESVLRHSDNELKVEELRHRFQGKTVLLGVDDMDVIKGINLKLLAMEKMLDQHREWQERAVLVQIINPAEGGGRDIVKIQDEIQESVDRINGTYGEPGYEPIVIINQPASLSERVAYYTIAKCVVVTAVRDGLNLIPYEYVVCRQGVSDSMLVVSEFIGCSASLSGAIRVNPWDIEGTAEAMNKAISMDDREKQLRHEKNYKYVSSHEVAIWSRSFFHDLKRTCKDHSIRTRLGFGFGFDHKVVCLDPNFKKLSNDHIVSAYLRSKNRAILLDYDGTLIPHTSSIESPGEELISIINNLSNDVKNTVFIVSGRGRESIGRIFHPCPKLGIAAEHGFFMRWPANQTWETSAYTSAFEWKEIAEPVMQHYTQATDGSNIEHKECALVWHHRYAHPEFGSTQAKEMLDHLASLLANQPVAVKSGHFIVEVKPQEINKGVAAEKVFKAMAGDGRQADFVLCIGNDRSDEEMFAIIGSAISNKILSSNTSVFACTVGQKPSKAKYYLDEPTDVVNMLKTLVDASLQEIPLWPLRQ